MRRRRDLPSVDVPVEHPRASLVLLQLRCRFMASDPPVPTPPAWLRLWAEDDRLRDEDLSASERVVALSKVADALGIDADVRRTVERATGPEGGVVVDRELERGAPIAAIARGVYGRRDN